MREITIKLSAGIVDVVINDDFESIFILNKLCIQKGILPPWPKETIFRGEEKIQFADSNSKVVVTSTKKSLTIWNDMSLERKNIDSTGLITKVLLSEDENYVYYLEDMKNIYKVSLNDYSNQLMYSSPEIFITDFIFSSKYLILSNRNSEIVIFDKFTNKEIKKINKEAKLQKPIIENFQIVNNILYYSANFVMFSFNVDNLDEEEEEVFLEFGATIGIARVSFDNQFILKSDLPRSPKDPNPTTVKIFFSKKDTPIKTINYHKGGITDFQFSKDGKFFFVSSEDKTLSIWNKLTLDLLTAITVSKPIRCFTISPNQEKIFIAEDGDMFISENPLNASNLRVFGPSMEYFLDYIKYIKRVSDDVPQELKKRLIPHNPEMDKFIISPSLMNAMHLYSWFGYFDAYDKALPTVSFHNNNQGKNPLTLLIKRDESEKVMFTLRAKCEEIKNNQYALGFMNTLTLKELNIKGYPGLEEIYDLIFQPISASYLPKYCTDNLTLPKVYYSLFIDPIQTNFARASEFVKEGTPLTFWISNIGINMISGSQESLDLLESIIECSNDEIFITKYIRQVLTDKWQKVKWLMCIQGIIYALYLIFFTRPTSNKFN